MITFLNTGRPWFMALAAAFTFVFTFCMLALMRGRLPKDGGRDFAFNGKLSAGKARGAGLVFIITFTLSALLFVKPSFEYLVFYALIFLSMLSGYLDDRAKTPWGEYKKGAIDLLICAVTAFAFIRFNPDSLLLGHRLFRVEVPWYLFLILTTVFLWMMINATNCSDGIDGFCGSLSINSMIFILLFGAAYGMEAGFRTQIVLMIFAIAAYLWFNCEPSTMMMGDAGSRAIGLFIGIAILKTGNLLLAIPLCFVLLLDGLIGIFKVSCMRFLKLKVLQKVRTPLHDHFRKNLGWSNTQTIFRFHLAQVLLSYITFKLLG